NEDSAVEKSKIGESAEERSNYCLPSGLSSHLTRYFAKNSNVIKHFINFQESFFYQLQISQIICSGSFNPYATGRMKFGDIILIPASSPVPA
ncbi:MAG: hypothetical protein ACHQEM_13525, partial [Chitinophagales bacterium]